MGTEVAWVPWVAAALSAGTGAYAAREEAKGTDRALARQIDDSAAKTREANQRVSESVSETAKNSAGAERASAMQQFTQALRAGNATATNGLNAQGGASERFNQESNQAALGVGDYGMARANTAATIDSILRQRQNEAEIRGRTNVDLSNITRQERMQNFLNGLKVRGAANSQAGMRALSGLLGGVASASSGMAGGGGGGSGNLYDPDAYAAYANGGAGFNFNF